MKIERPLDGENIKEIDIQYGMIASAAVSAEIFVEENELEVQRFNMDELTTEDVEALTASVQAVVSSGSKFTIPMLIPEGLESGDNRSFKEGALSHRDLPLPLLWQIKTGSGHDGSVVVGRIDSIEKLENGLGNAKGVFDVGIFGREAERLVRGGFLRGVSADLDKFEGEKEEEDDDEFSSNKIRSEKISVDKGRVMAATLVAKPAFQECAIMLEDEASLSTDGDEIEDGEYEEEMLDDVDNALAALAASAAPLVPPKKWFRDPKLDGPTPLTVTDDGRVYGHVAAWNVSHIGLPRATKPPRSASQYAYFRTGVLRTDEGDVQVGQLTLSGGHAPLTADAEAAVKHYDDTNSAVADVAAGEDRHGIWVAGALRPEVTPQQVRAFRASSPSGDWRPIGGRLELVAVCAVNVPGFPVARAITAGGQITALVAAGARPIAELRDSDISRLEERVNTLESMELSARREAALKRLSPLLEKKNEELSAMAASAHNRFNEIKEQREAKELADRMEELRKKFNNR